MTLKLSLRAKATLLAGLLVVVLLGVVGWLQSRQLERDMRTLVQEQLDTLSESVAEGLSVRLDMLVAVVEHAAGLLDPATLADRARAQQFISSLAATRVFFDGTAIVDTEGVVRYNDPPMADGTLLSLADRPYFHRVRDGGRTVISEPVLSRNGRGPTVLVVAPVRGPKGQVLGYLAAGLHLDRGNALGSVAQDALGRTGHFEIVTAGPNPVYVVHPDSTRLLKPAPVQARGDLDVPYLTAAKPLRNVDWQLRVVLPQWEADAPLVQAYRRQLVELAAMGLGAGLLAWVGMTWLLRPLGTLRDVMERLRQQPNSTAELDTRSHDERGDLARAFVSLMQEVRTRQAETLAISERSPLGMFRAEPDGRLSYVNSAYLAIHALEPEAASDGWLSLVPPEEREAAWAHWCETVRRPEPTQITRDLIRPDGTACQLVVRSAPVVVDGAVLGHVGTVFDATERNRQEKALRVLTAIFEATPDYVVQTDRHGQITYANPAIRRLERLAPDAPVAHLNFAAFNTTRTTERFTTEILPAVHEHGMWLGETQILDGVGDTVTVNHLVIAHRNRNGQIDHYSAVMRDVSGEVAARQEAESAAAALRAVAELSPATLTVVGADLRYRFVNSAFERRIGRPRMEILGCHAREVLGDEEYELSLPHAQRALAGETVEFERESLTPKGPRILAVSYVPITLPSGVVDGLVGAAQDITQHRQEALHLRKLSERDPLTGLLNRAGFEARLRALAGNAGTARLALLYLDLDRFKPVNDTYGHAAGDAVLRAVSERLQQQVRPSDPVARLGGDEFGVLLPDMPDAVMAERIAAKLAQAIAEPVLFEGRALQVGASVGVVYGVQAGESPHEFVARADRRMFEAKAARR